MSIIEKISETKYLSGSTLKIIACISMFIDHFFHILMRTYRDHVAALDYDTIKNFNTLYKIGRGIGRIAFPIFCFLLVEGFLHTKDIRKYLARIFVMALLSEHAFNLLYSGHHMEPEGQSIFLTLFIGLLTIWGIDKIRTMENMPRQAAASFTLAIIIAGCLAAYLLKTDYSYHGIMSIAAIYLLRSDIGLTCVGGAISFIWEPWAIPAFIPIYFYNGKRGLRAKYIFYLFYPLHIYLIYFILTYVLPPGSL